MIPREEIEKAVHKQQDDWLYHNKACNGASLKNASAADRKGMPVATGVLDYFPDALCAVAECSKKGNDQHNPGEPLHWAREKGGNDGDALIRHFMERGGVDSDGVRHSAKVAWRALALLQREIDEAGKGPQKPPTEKRIDVV